jgi:hypothetical protein
VVTATVPFAHRTIILSRIKSLSKRADSIRDFGQAIAVAGLADRPNQDPERE